MGFRATTLKAFDDAQVAVSAHDVTIGHLARQLLIKEVERRLHPVAPRRAGSGLIAALQTLLAHDMAAAGGWNDLRARLARHGYDLRPAGFGAALYKTSCNTLVCKASELGFGYRKLVRRFGTPMPDHPDNTAWILSARDPSDDVPLQMGEGVGAIIKTQNAPTMGQGVS